MSPPTPRPSRPIRQLFLPLILSALLLPIVQAAEIYRYRAPDGSIVFTDDPPPGSQRIEVHPNLTVGPDVGDERTPAAAADEGSVPAKPAATPAGYDSVTIVSPAADEAIRDNAGNLTVSIETQPALRGERGDRLLVLLDGAPVGAATTATRIRLENIDRGSHTLQAVIVDPSGRPLLKSPVHRFHVLRYSRLFRKAGPGP